MTKRRSKWDRLLGWAYQQARSMASLKPETIEEKFAHCDHEVNQEGGTNGKPVTACISTFVDKPLSRREAMEHGGRGMY
jgi:hypothetical protein